LIAFFQRGARDDRPEPVIAKPRPQNLNGGSAVRPTQDELPDDDDAFIAMAVHLGRNGGRNDSALQLGARELEDA
jgi:hypothetical protein